MTQPQATPAVPPRPGTAAESIQNILMLVADKDALFADGAIRQLAEDAAKRLAAEMPPMHLPVHVAIVKDFCRPGQSCPDSGKCHHACEATCSRTDGCFPLSLAKSFIGDDWKVREPGAPVSADEPTAA